MAQTLAMNTRALWTRPIVLLLLVASLAIPLSGCADSCFSFTSNPPTGTVNIAVSDNKPTCNFARVNGTVRVVAQSSLASASSGSAQVRHIFVTLRGIDVHASTIADDTSPDWQELLPQLRAHPLQVDLITTGAAPAPRQRLGEAVIPADTYRQLRLRFVASSPNTAGDMSSEDALPTTNACGSPGFNCVVLTDGRIQPLLLNAAVPQLRMTSQQLSGGSLLVPPDSHSNLVIQFGVLWSLSTSDVEPVRVLPKLVASVSLERPSAE